jgi:membrane-associated phospholipid phosphatase
MLALLSGRGDRWLARAKAPEGPESPESGQDPGAAMRERRLTIARWVALGIWALVVVVRSWISGLPFNRELLLLYICTGLIAASIGRRRLLLAVRDWLPFAAILVIYDFSRGAATLLGAPTLWEIQPRIDRWLSFGVEPTVWLQEHLKQAHPPWWEVITSVVYMSLFVVPYAIGGIAWLHSRSRWRAYVRRFVPLWLIALVFYAVLPAAPPWAASRCTADEVAGGPSHPACMAHSPALVPDGGVLGPMHTSQIGAHQFVERISTRGWFTLHLDAARALINEGQASVNLVAAMPSVHAALSAMAALFLWRRVHVAWRPVLVTYVFAMAFTLVYSAEHYVVDILAGWALAAIVALVVNRLEARAKRGARPATEIVTAEPISAPAG